MRVEAYADDALADLDGTGVAERIEAGRASVSEVVRAAIARIQRVDPTLNALQCPDFDHALERATRRRSGAFAGVPVVIKDNVDLAGLPTREGSRAVPEVPARRSGPFVEQLLAMGMVPVGKSTLPEFGFNASTEYADGSATHNPWDTAYSAGASSGGSAALVASGAVPIGHGNDGGGSIRIPAAACGLVGMKATRGRLVPEPRTQQIPVRIVTQGILTRSVRDTARFYTAAERLSPAPNLPPIGAVTGPGRRRLRIGVARDSVVPGAATDTETNRAVTDIFALLERMGHQVEEIALPGPESLVDDFAGYWRFLAFLLTTFGKRMYGGEFAPERCDNLTRGLASSYRRNPATTLGMVRRLRRSSVSYREVFRNLDVVCSPVVSHTTPRLGYLSPAQDFDTLFARLVRYTAFTPWNNASGGPAITLPSGCTAGGLPVGVEFSADHGDERTLLQLAFEVEEACPWLQV